jgi:Uma2 family endonuclease
LFFSRDDGIVVVVGGRMSEDRVSVYEYFQYPESTRRMELVWGRVREPPAPRWGHQAVVTRLTELLAAYVRSQGLGHVCVSPIDVVLDEDQALVVQPDLVFVSNERMPIVRSRIFGAPDLAIEVLSFGTAFRDRTEKLAWYRDYGVRECWLVDTVRCSVEVFPLEAGADARTFEGPEAIQSFVLPGLDVPAGSIFE